MTGRRARDGALAAIVLAWFLGLFAVVDAAVSIPAAILGGVGAVAVELAATRHASLVRTAWERPATQLVALCLGMGVGFAGAVLAPTALLSVGVGALVAYLAMLVGVSTRDRLVG